MNIIQRIEEGKIEFLKRALEADSLYLGQQEIIKLKNEIKLWEIQTLIEINTIHGLKLYQVNENSHFAVAKTKF